MTERLRSMTDAELEAALRDVAHALAPTAAPDLARAVRLRIVATTSASEAMRPVGGLGSRLTRIGRPARRSLILALVALLALAGIVGAIGLGLPGLRFIFLRPPATGSPSAIQSPAQSPSGAGTASPAPTAVRSPTPLDLLHLGQPVDPTTATGAAGYRVLLPTLPELGHPLGVFVDGASPAVQVSAVYAASPRFPGAPGAAAAILVTEFPGRLDEGFFQKGFGAGTTVTPTAVGGQPGYWIAGEPHELFYVRPDGSVDRDSIRLVGNVLAWTDGDLTLRVEGAPDLASALRIAASLR